ncbi:ribosomal-protein-alanine acetyltransferase, partial [Pseudomonas syringae pv. actinidiae]|nr:ribosomal-protein-alanine acetyltransferase [Pseudomonas syringae pv. actinidiae]
HADFNRMSCFGADKLRAAVIVFAAPVDDHACAFQAASAARPQDPVH